MVLGAEIDPMTFNLQVRCPKASFTSIVQQPYTSLWREMWLSYSVVHNTALQYHRAARLPQQQKTTFLTCSFSLRILCNFMRTQDCPKTCRAAAHRRSSYDNFVMQFCLRSYGLSHLQTNNHTIDVKYKKIRVTVTRQITTISCQGNCYIQYISRCGTSSGSTLLTKIRLS